MGEILAAHVSVQRKSESRCLLVSMLKATGVTKYIIPFPKYVMQAEYLKYATLSVLRVGEMLTPKK